MKISVNLVRTGLKVIKFMFELCYLCDVEFHDLDLINIRCDTLEFNLGLKVAVTTYWRHVLLKYLTNNAKDFIE